MAKKKEKQYHLYTFIIILSLQLVKSLEELDQILCSQVPIQK